MVFVGWHLFALAVWLAATDTPSALSGALMPIVRPYMTFTGFMQDWHLFSPNPSRQDLYLEARITYADGRTAGWEFPHTSHHVSAARHRQEHYDKLVEQGQAEAARMIWPSLARYAARRNDLNPHDPPVTVVLVRHIRLTPPPGAAWPPFQAVPFYRAAITAADLH